MESMRTRLFVSRLLLVFLSALAVTNAWSHNETKVANLLAEEHKTLSSVIIGDISPWTNKKGTLVASNGSYPRADLSLHKSVNNPEPWVGDKVTFTITVNNSGPKGADYSFEDVVPSGYSNITHISNGGKRYGSVITWKRQWIGAGKSQNFTFRATVKTPTGAVNEYKNIAQITKSNRLDPDSAPNNDDGDQSEDDEDFATVKPKKKIADLSLLKNVNNSTPNIDEVVTFTITVNNAGPKGADYSIEDTIPNGYSHINNISNGGTLNENIINWNGQWIDAHETQKFIFYAKVKAPDCKAIDQYKNVAEISYSNKPDSDSTPNNDDGDQSEDDEDSATVVPDTNICDQIADLSLQKDVNNATPNVGDTVTFTINVSNAGPDTATNVGISDVVPAGL